MGFFNFFKRDISEEEFQEQQKVKRGLEKTRTGFFQSIVNTLTNAQIDDDLYDQLEEQLILADVGPACAVRLVDELHDEVKEKHLKTGQEALDALRGIICQELTPRYPMDLDGKPAVILVIGVNGVGKTTTIAKLAGLYKKQGRHVMLAAGDTFRAAASEQLELWAERADVPLVQAGMGADPAAVIFDAVKSANARGYDMVIADTAGRLHNKKGLMDELSKISRSVKKASPEASLEVLLVLDAITGQNAISQAEEFCKAANATGVVLTKLDGTPRGGCAVSVWENLGLPIRFIGVGEKIDDLMEFGKQKTCPLLHRNLEGMHHVPDDDRFSPDKKHDTEQSRQQPPHICPPHCFHHCAKVFAVENTVYRQRKNHNEKNGIHDHFFLTLHGVSTSFVPISCHTMHQDACVPRSATSLLPEALRQSHLQSHAALLSA